MSSCTNNISAEVGDVNHQSVLPDEENLEKSSECPVERMDAKEEDEEEDNDVDFKPFLIETCSLEASSSLSSEFEVLDADVADSGKNTCAALVTDSLSKPSGPVQDYTLGDSEPGEEIVMQTAVSSVEEGEKGLENTSSTRHKEGKSVLISQPKNETFGEKKKDSSSQTEVISDAVRQFHNSAPSRTPIIDMDDEDAICRRTRARYSLASFTLDELEAFLQETDGDEDLQNVDDEEEYKKFLAAVLRGGDGDDQNLQENENVDDKDEDEDNDADFELEIDEALESDLDENTRVEAYEQEYETVGRRPKTRQSRRKKGSLNHKEFMGQSNRPLRPLLPSAPIASLTVSDGKSLLPKNAPQFPPIGCVNVFSPHQIGQLHCLIHEHVQLLIQVFSLCVFEPARRHIASALRGLISEMLHKRDQVLVWRKVPYPSFYFRPPHIHPSVPDGIPKILPAQCTSESSSQFDAQGVCSSGNNIMPPSNIISHCKGRYEYLSNGQVGYLTTGGLLWSPYISIPVLSVLDVAPLRLVGSYMDDVSTAMQNHPQQYLGSIRDTRFDMEPLFPRHGFQSFSEANDHVSREIIPPASKMVLSSSTRDQMPRKTMAAALIERAKKQSVALVPKEIANLAQRFFPLFNATMYPHKPPPSAVANRVLFTDAEDELLAMGLMQYNTDWKAIQQHFIPCKSKHQIFVRQKNRASSKAPENPIKAVRRMKNSPLTEEERALIEKGLKFFKLDWMSIWKLFVPYRDPSLLPRQWRIATGTQKSYKIDADKNAKRRLYELKRRASKAATLASWHTASEKEDNSTDNAGDENKRGADCMYKEDEAYVHEAFLADWRPGNSSVSVKRPYSDRGKNLPTYVLSGESSHVGEQMLNYGSGVPQPQMDHLPAALRPNSQVYLRPYRSPRTNNARLVRLAPDLPPLNLPPSVRIMSQSAFKSYQGGSAKVTDADSRMDCDATKNIVPMLACVEKSGTNFPTEAGQNRSDPLKQITTDLHLQGSEVLMDKSISEEKDESGLQMHPLLFQALEDDRVPHYQVNCSTNNPSSFNIFPKNQPQLELGLFHNPHQASHAVNFFDKPLKSKKRIASTFGTDFHPLLQSTDNASCDSEAACSAARLSASLEPLGSICDQFENPIDAILAKSCINGSPIAKPSSPIRRNNEFDLEGHLSCTSSESKEVGSRDVTERDTVRPIVRVPASRTSEFQETQNLLDPSNEYMPTEPTLEGISKQLDSGAHAIAISSNEKNRNAVDSIGDHSLPEILMEREELSDSDDGIGENVEFECEEMDDSEGDEGSDSEQNLNVLNIQNKVEKVVADAGFRDQHRKPSTEGNLEGNVCGLSTDKQQDNERSSLCLDLNSCPPGSPPKKPNRAVPKYMIGSDGKIQASSCSNRRCKNTKRGTKHGRVQKHAVDMPQQPNLGSVAVAPPMKPRKRAFITDSSLSTGRANKRHLNLNIETTGEHGAC